MLGNWLRIVVSVFVLAIDHSGGLKTGSRESDFADFLLARPILVEGIFMRADTVSRTMVGGCQFPSPSGLGPYESLELHIRVTRVLQGSLNDSMIVVTTLGRPQFMPGEIQVGSRVLAWAFREAADGWQLWGRMAAVSSNGEVIGSLQDRGRMFLRGRASEKHFQFVALDSTLAARLHLKGEAVFDGAKGVAWVRLNGGESLGNERVAFTIDSLGIAMGHSLDVPKRVVISTGVRACEFPMLGDTILVPLHEGASDFEFAGCPHALMTDCGFVSTLGVTIANLDRALELSPTISVRPFIRRD